MAYTDFTLEDLETQFGIKSHRRKLFGQLTPIAPSEKLQSDLELVNELYIKSEKAKSETIVFPILVELRRRNNKYFTIYSGDTLNADESRGLKGECDFILAKDINSAVINYPIFQLVEAKRNDIEEGIRQCSAQLVGAKIFNERKGTPLEKLYGCATTGDDWLFIELVGNDLFLDTQKYYLGELDELLGIFQFIIDYYKKILN